MEPRRHHRESVYADTVTGGHAGSQSHRLAEFNLIIRRRPLTARIPDLAVFQIATIVERDGRIHSAPHLIVEVLSPANTRRERAEKLADYASPGVPEVWVFSPEASHRRSPYTLKTANSAATPFWPKAS